MNILQPYLLLYLFPFLLSLLPHSHALSHRHYLTYSLRIGATFQGITFISECVRYSFTKTWGYTIIAKAFKWDFRLPWSRTNGILVHLSVSLS